MGEVFTASSRKAQASVIEKCEDTPKFFVGAVANNPMSRMEQADEVAIASVYLASQTAGIISGTNGIFDETLTHGGQYRK